MQHTKRNATPGVESTDVVSEAVITRSGVERLGRRRLDQVGDRDGICAPGTWAARADASAGSLAVRALLLAGEALPVVAAFVDGVFAHAKTLGQLGGPVVRWFDT